MIPPHPSSSSSSSSSSRCFMVLLNLFLLLLLVRPEVLKGQNNTSRVPAFLAFGDSILDTGNNNFIPTLLKSNFPPYGKYFPGHRPTGRFSDGKISTDLIASALGLKDAVPPYLDPSLQLQDLLTGVSFASAGTGYDILTSKTLSVLTMWDQIEMFKEYIEKLKKGVGEERATSIISTSLYLVSSGSNDLVISYSDTGFRKLKHDVPSYVNLLLHSAISFLKELYDLGARKIALVGLIPLGCLPLQRTLQGGIERKCSDSVNEAALLFNSKLSMELFDFSKNFTGARTVYMDFYNHVLEVIQHPFNYGFEESSKSCCGTGLAEISYLCNSFSSHTCANSSKYLFWDSIHPSERATQIVIDKFVVGYLSQII